MQYDTAINGIRSAAEYFQPYMVDYEARLNYHLQTFDSLTGGGEASRNIEKAYFTVIESMTEVVYADYIEYNNPGTNVPTGDALWDSLTSQEIVSYLYPDAVNIVEIEEGISSGEISASDIIVAMAETSFSDESLDVDAIKSISESADSSYDDEVGDEPATLPDANLTFPGVDDAELDFLIALYVGAFGRSPEHEGLEYWASVLSDRMGSGQTFDAAIHDISGWFYNAGMENGESGTDMTTYDFVGKAYQNILGRAPDSEGQSYWADKIDSGNIHKGNFLVYFISAAMEDGRDGDYVDSVVAASEFIAQDHVSGESVDIELLESVLTITNAESALDINNGVADNYGVLPGQDVDVVGTSSASDYVVEIG